MPAFDDAAALVVPLDDGARAAAAARHRRLTTPPSALGRLEAAGTRLAAVAGRCPPPVPEPAAVAVFAGDHGVLEEGISPWPQEVTAQMVAHFAEGAAAVNVLAGHVGARVVVVDVGVATELPPAPGLLAHKVRPGTANLAVGPAMTVEEARRALDVGATIAAELVDGGVRCLLTGDMGTGNTTSCSALVAAFTGRSPERVTGREAGIDGETWADKVVVVAKAAARAVGRPPLEVLAEMGGLEIAALAGYVIGGAAARVPVLLDGSAASAAAVVAAALVPDCAGYLFAGHRSADPGAAAALDHLGLDPLLDLDLRLGEGSGACLALPVLQASAKVLAEMATFEPAVSGHPAGD